MSRRLAPWVPAVAILANVSGCLHGPAPAVPTPTPKPTATPKPSPTPTPVGATPAPLKSKSSLVFTAVEFGAGNDIVARIFNQASADIAILADKYKLCGGEFVYGMLSKTKTTIPAGATVKMHVNSPSGCTESATEFCVEAPTGVTATQGNLGLYKGIEFTEFNKEDKMLDFVEWGAAGLAREDVAVRGSFWREGKFVPVTAGQASISVKATGASGPENWQ